MTLQENGILVSDSLAETLWRLEEARRGFRSGADTKVTEALNWVLSRQGLKGSYRGLFAPTQKDLLGVKLLTGESIFSGGALRHILGEEALRTVTVWKLEQSPTIKKAKESFFHLLELGEPPVKTTGYYCCHTCTPAFLRTLAVVKPDGWKTTLQKGVENIRKKRTPDGKWHGFPFYYTLLTLSEIDLPSAKVELRHAKTTARRLLNRYQKEDRISRFRKIGLEATMTA